VLALALQVTLLVLLHRGAASWAVRLAAGLSLLLWLATLVAGRWLGLI
jgi:hypothetical protein